MPTVNGKKYPYTAAGKAAAKKAAAKKPTSYLGNVAKEVKQTAKSASNAVDKYLNGNRPLPKGIKIGPSNVKKEVGQLAGAVLQGRRYDDKTGKQIVTPKKSTRSTTPSVSQRPAKPRGTAAPKRVPAVGTRNESMKPKRILKGTATATPQLPSSSKKLGKMTKKAYK